MTVDHHGTRETVTADHYVAAMPVEQLRPLLSPELVAAEPRLAATRRLRTRWMNGVMFYLHHDVPILAGHTIYSDSDWALTSISQRQFWPRTDFARARRRDTSAGVLSVDVSDWERPVAAHGQGGLEVQRRRDQGRGVGAAQGPPQRPGARRPRRRQPRERLPRRGHHLPQPERGRERRAAAHQHRRLVGRPARGGDAACRTSSSPRTSCARTPTWPRWRAPTRPRGARSTASSTPRARAPTRCDVWKLPEPAIFGPARALDRVRWTLGHRPAKPPLRVTADGRLEPVGLAGRLLSLRRRSARPVPTRPGCRRPR